MRRTLRDPAETGLRLARCPPCRWLYAALKLLQTDHDHLVTCGDVLRGITGGILGMMRVMDYTVNLLGGGWIVSQTGSQNLTFQQFRLLEPHPPNVRLVAVRTRQGSWFLTRANSVARTRCLRSPVHALRINSMLTVPIHPGCLDELGLRRQAVDHSTTEHPVTLWLSKLYLQSTNAAIKSCSR